MDENIIMVIIIFIRNGKDDAGGCAVGRAAGVRLNAFYRKSFWTKSKLYNSVVCTDSERPKINNRLGESNIPM